jgi:hypothetical protein
LLQDVAQLKRTIEEAPLRMDAYVKYKEQLEQFLAEKKQISYEESKDPIIVRLYFYRRILKIFLIYCICRLMEYLILMRQFIRLPQP